MNAVRKIGLILLWELLLLGTVCGLCFGIRVESTRWPQEPLVDIPAEEVGWLEMQSGYRSAVVRDREVIERVIGRLNGTKLGRAEPYDEDSFLIGGPGLGIEIYRKDGTLYRGMGFLGDGRLSVAEEVSHGAYYELEPALDLADWEQIVDTFADEPDFWGWLE